ncbi:hypothetical protein SETIT_9G229400v2 [Setaria italica]|uniref:Uncharacterized protein n=1 Tax=Setaria italica TaxID=4555 RepID=A0A368SJU3_SETIT|nr:hypothetical protein SETIT_9G229400v2 [Setaria italica]
MTARQRARGRSAPADELLHHCSVAPTNCAAIRPRRGAGLCPNATMPLLPCSCSPPPAPPLRPHSSAVPSRHGFLRSAPPSLGLGLRVASGSGRRRLPAVLSANDRVVVRWTPPPRAARLSLNNEAHLQGGRRWV